MEDIIRMNGSNRVERTDQVFIADFTKSNDINIFEKAFLCY